MTGTLHRMIFAFVVGLVALVAFIILWIVSIPLQTLQLSHWRSEKAASTAEKEDGQVNIFVISLRCLCDKELLQ